jgi:hypothetical protein
VKLVLNAPLLSRGNWGDGAAPKSIVDMCLQSEGMDEVIHNHFNPLASVLLYGWNHRGLTLALDVHDDVERS